MTSVDVNHEDPEMICDCGERIPSAYAEDEYEARGLLAKLDDGKTLTSDELSKARNYTLESENSINAYTIAALKEHLGHLPGPHEE